MADIELPNPEDAKEAAKDRFTKRVALTVAVYAVALAFAALGGGNCMKETMLSQMQAANTWSRYQSKVNRQYLYELEAEKLAIELEEKEGLSPAARTRKEAMVKKIEGKIKTYEKDREELTAEAKAFEAVRDRGLVKDPYFDFAEVLLQIAIVCASVAMLAGSRPMFAISLVLAACGIFLTLNGFLLLVKVPFLAD